MSSRRPPVEGQGANTAGLPEQGEPAFIMVGKVRRPHGVDGELLVETISGDARRFKPGLHIFLGAERQELTVRSSRRHDQGVLLALTGIEDPDGAGRFRNQAVYITRADLPPLPPGEYYHFQLIGLQVVTSSGKPLGRLCEILETGANDVYLVRDENGSELLLPVIPGVVLEVDLAGGRIVAAPPEWL